MYLQENKFLKRFFLYPFLIKKPIQAPICPGVYLLTITNGLFEELYYIGSSKHLRGRLAGHSTCLYLKKKYKNLNIYIIPTRIEDYKELEIFLIENMKPILNITHNLKKSA